MGGCGVPGCKSRTEKKEDGIRFFNVPILRTNVPLHSQRRLQRRRALWLSRIGKMELMNRDVQIRVCSRHFISGKPAVVADETNPDWAPFFLRGQNDAPGRPGVHADPECDPLGGCQPEYDHVETQEQHIAAHASTHNQVYIVCENPSSLAFTSTLNAVDEEPIDPLQICEVQCDFKVPKSSILIPNLYTGDSAVGHGRVHSTVLSDSAASEFQKLKDEHNRLIAEYNDLKMSYARLQNKLTEANADKLRLSNAKAILNKNFEEYSVKCASLSAECKTYKGQAKQSEELANMYHEQTKIAEEKICNLEVKLASAEKCVLTLELLQNNDEAVKLFTGLPYYGVFNVVLTLVSTVLTDKTHSLEPWQCLLMTLMRLKMGLQLEDVAHRFGISKSSVSFIFEKWLYYLYLCLEPFITWPDRKTQYKTMPNAFKEAFGEKACVIIDCLELFCERPSSLDAQDTIWPNYKHHHIVKYLIGMTPVGVIIFVSQGWGGRVSDEHLTAHSGIYEKLLPNDIILADRGFTIGEDIGLYCSKLLTPASTNGQAQLSAHDISDTLKLANLRAEVQGVIGLVKNKYRILQTILNHDMLEVKQGHKVAQIDEVVRVCCALINLSPVIV